MRSPSGASNTALKLLLPASGSTRKGSSAPALVLTAVRTETTRIRFRIFSLRYCPARPRSAGRFREWDPFGHWLAANKVLRRQHAHRAGALRRARLNLGNRALDQQIQSPIQHHAHLVTETHELGEVERPPDEPGEKARQLHPKQMHCRKVLADRDERTEIEISKRFGFSSRKQTNEIARGMGALLER